ncbi:single-stranded DNA-binding protein [Nonomuraea sp. NPDC049607]|uniref:single-stranded DNA-binding protein n=1 Tax=Nonomuraea sp. NPDC049607 TaxID=3154732 RepID=UPI00341BB43B
MNDIYITLTGNVAAEPRQYSFDDGTRVTSLKVFTSHRYFDRKTGQWTDGERVCFTVRCWRALGDNVAGCVRAGQPVVVSGKLRIREFGAEGDRRFMPEIEASAVGHDLRWGTGAFTKPERGGGLGSMTKEMRERLDEETQDWAMGTRPVRPPSRPTADPSIPLTADPSVSLTADAAGTVPAQPHDEDARPEADHAPMAIAATDPGATTPKPATPPVPVPETPADPASEDAPASGDYVDADTGTREHRVRGSATKTGTVRPLGPTARPRTKTQIPEKAAA